jgi:hypothetical protein
MRVHTKQLERIEKELREIVRMLALLFGGGVAVFVYALVRGWAGN